MMSTSLALQRSEREAMKSGARSWSSPPCGLKKDLWTSSLDTRTR